MSGGSRGEARQRPGKGGGGGGGGRERGAPSSPRPPSPSSPPRPMPRAHAPTALALCCIAAAIAAAVAFSGPDSLNGPFLVDDTASIERNQAVTGEFPLSDLWVVDYWGTELATGASHKSWRPITTLTFRWDYAANGLDPRTFHITDRLIHVLNSALSVVCADAVMGGASLPAATVAGIVFAVHPVHAESVSNSSGRAETLCALFFTVGYLAYAGFVRRGFDRAGVSAAVAFAFCAMLCKEHGITLPIACAAWDALVHVRASLRALRRPDGPRTYAKLINRVAWLAAATVAMGLWRKAKNGEGRPLVNRGQNPACFHDDFLVRWLSILWLHVVNLKMLVWPFGGMCADWTGGTIPLIHPRAEDSQQIAVIGAMYAGAAWLLKWSLWSRLGDGGGARGEARAASAFPGSSGSSERARKRDEAKATYGMAAAWFVAAFVLSSNLVTCVGFVVAERVLYLPSFGICVAAGAALDAVARAATAAAAAAAAAAARRPKGKRRGRADHLPALVLFAAPIVAALCLRCMQQDRTWSSEEALWGNAWRVNPRGYLVGPNYGTILIQQNREEEAEVVLRSCIANYKATLPWQEWVLIAWFSLGMSHVRRGESQKAGLTFAETAQIAQEMGNHYELQRRYSLETGDLAEAGRAEAKLESAAASLSFALAGVSLVAPTIEDQFRVAKEAVEVPLKKRPLFVVLTYQQAKSTYDYVVAKVEDTGFGPEDCVVRHSDTGADPETGAGYEVWLRNQTLLKKTKGSELALIQ